MKICQWNVENLFILMDRYKDQDLEKMSEDEWQSLSLSTTTKNKPLGIIFEIVDILREIDADVYMLCEVGGVDSFNNLCTYFLPEYKYCSHDGNSSRGIAVGFLVKKDIEYTFKFKSLRGLPLENGRRLSRDLARLDVFKNKKMVSTLLLTHLKSLRNSAKDFNGYSQREAEINGIVSYHTKVKKDVPIIIGGDLNDDIHTSPAFISFQTSQLVDVHQLKSSSEVEKCTHVSFYGSGRRLNQLDYLLLDSDFSGVVDLSASYTYRFKTAYGDVMDLPESFAEKKYHPSDHYPLIVKLNI